MHRVEESSAVGLVDPLQTVHEHPKTAANPLADVAEACLLRQQPHQAMSEHLARLRGRHALPAGAGAGVLRQQQQRRSGCPPLLEGAGAGGVEVAAVEGVVVRLANLLPAGQIRLRLHWTLLLATSKAPL
jgi:hypothetical protein